MMYLNDISSALNHRTITSANNKIKPLHRCTIVPLHRKIYLTAFFVPQGSPSFVHLLP